MDRGGIKVTLANKWMSIFVYRWQAVEKKEVLLVYPALIGLLTVDKVVSFDCSSYMSYLCWASRVVG